jgi:putative ATP-dependent endonuclease of the OLD family
MYVCLLEIQGFRGIRAARIVLEQHSVLLGTNNVGKSAVVDALGLVLGRDRLVRSLGDYDFFGGAPTPQSRIFIKATITGFEPDDPDKHCDWFNANDGAIPLWWDGKLVLAGDRPQGGRLCTQIAFAARFDADDLEAEIKRYFVDGEGDPFEAQNLAIVKPIHLKTLGFFLLPAQRTWDRVVSFGSELFRRVLRFQDAMPSQAVPEIRDSIRDPSVKLEEDSQICDVVARVNDELAGFVGKDEAGLRFRLTAGDTESVLQALTPHLQGRCNAVLPISRHGSGIVSLQTLLLLFEFGRARQDQKENFILAAEEPELHLHPGHHSVYNDNALPGDRRLLQAARSIDSSKRRRQP